MANAFRQTKIIRNFDSVGSGGMATLRLPTGIRVHRLDIFYANGATQMTAAVVDGIFKQHRLKVGASEFRTWTPDVNRLINAAKGLPTFVDGTSTVKTAMYSIYFSEPQRRLIGEEDATAFQAYPEYGVNDWTLEIDVAAAYGGSATTPALYARIEFDYVKAPNSKFGMFWKRGSIPVAGATQAVYNTIVKPAMYSRLHLLSANITKLEVNKKNETIQRFDSRAEYENALTATGFTAQADVWSIIGDSTNRLGDVINLDSGDSFEILPTTSAGGDIGLIYEELRQLRA